MLAEQTEDKMRIKLCNEYRKYNKRYNVKA